MKRPARIHPELTKKLREMYRLMPLLSPATPKDVTCYAVRQRRGRAYYKARVITVSVWAMTVGKGPGYDLYYLAHELAHIANYDANPHDPYPHGPGFMAKFKEICPKEFQHYELGYKPRRAAAAGIRSPKE